MHLTDVPYITKQNAEWLIGEFLREFSVVCPNINIKILVVGGSALAIKHAFRGTVDIDAEIRTNREIGELLKSTAKRLNIPEDFINSDFRYSFSYSRYLWDDAICIYTRGLCGIRFISVVYEDCIR